jgi:hypothetical protein
LPPGLTAAPLPVLLAALSVLCWRSAVLADECMPGQEEHAARKALTTVMASSLVMMMFEEPPRLWRCGDSEKLFAYYDKSSRAAR